MLSHSNRPPSLLDTQDFPTYQSAINTSFVPLRAVPSERLPFHARLAGTGADGVMFTEIGSTPQLVERDQEMIDHGGRGFYKVSLLLSGTSILIQDGREVVMRPGDISFYDTSRPYSLMFEEQFRNLIMMFPKDRLDFPPQLTDSMTAVSLNAQHPLAAAVASFIRQSSPQLEGLSEVARTKLAHSSLELLGTMFAAVLDTESPSRNPKQVLLHKIYTYIAAHLGSPELSPKSIAAAHFISTRHLHALFSDAELTVSSWIRERRLERCRADLMDPTLAHRGIANIAANWGFVDAAHFSRVFKSAYGVSPSEFRSADPE